VKNKGTATSEKFPKYLPKEKEKIFQKDINFASREDLIAVYGIGEKLADKILLEKEKLGGFVSMEQFQFIWGISPEAIADLEKRFAVKNSIGIKKIAINDLSQKELAKFPYFNYSLAKEIIIYRTMNNGIKNIDDLTKIKGMPNEKIKIIALYLNF
jgi:DNA uptake protein ComE-like DNA-binding protein